MPRILITGASRGLGLEHAKQYLAKGWQVISTARNPESSPGLRALASHNAERLRQIQMDVTDYPRVEAVAEELAGQSLDILLNNAGTYGPKSAFEGMHYQSLESMDYDLWREMHEINVMAAFKVAVCFKPHLEAAAHPLLVNMSSDMGSIGNNSIGHAYAYRSTKAALNMLTRGMAIEWQKPRRDRHGPGLVPYRSGWTGSAGGPGGERADATGTVRESGILSLRRVHQPFRRERNLVSTGRSPRSARGRCCGADAQGTRWERGHPALVESETPSFPGLFHASEGVPALDEGTMSWFPLLCRSNPTPNKSHFPA